jgi:hypothetical protein
MSFESIIYSPEFCFGAKERCGGQTTSLRYGLSPCLWSNNPDCREVRIWGTLPAPADYPDSISGKVHIDLPQSIRNGFHTEARGSLHTSGLQGRLESVDSGKMIFNVDNRLEQKWQNSRIDATWVWYPHMQKL